MVMNSLKGLLFLPHFLTRSAQRFTRLLCHWLATSAAVAVAVAAPDDVALNIRFHVITWWCWKTTLNAYFILFATTTIKIDLFCNRCVWVLRSQNEKVFSDIKENPNPKKLNKICTWTRKKSNEIQVVRWKIIIHFRFTETEIEKKRVAKIKMQ